jgi:hypothetical protein
MSVIPLLTVCLFNGTVAAQEFWSGTRYGMTKAQLRAKFGNELRPGEGKPADGAALYSAYTMETEICGGSFVVSFSFQPQKPADALRGVVLNMKQGTAIGEVFTNCILREFSAVYGKPVARDERRDIATYTFTKLDTRVDLTTIPRAGTAMIVYALKPKL